MVPKEGLTLIAGAGDDHALTLMLDTAERTYAESEEYRSLRAVVWERENNLVEWLPPPEHPLHARFKAAAAKTRLLEATNQHQLFLKEVAPLAHLAALPADQGGHFIASWMREADVVIPRVDKVVLFDTDDQPLSRVEIDFETLFEVLPHAFAPLGLEGEQEQLPNAQLFRARGALFPTLVMKRFLLQRMAYKAQTLGASERHVAGDELLAAWDAGEPIGAEVDESDTRRVLLRAPDFRVGYVTNDAFGTRMKERSARDQLAFTSSLMSAILLQAMRPAAEGDTEATDENTHATNMPTGDATGSENEVPLSERAGNERPLLMSSNELRAERKKTEEAAAGQSVGTLAAQVLRDVFENLEPSRLLPLVRPPGYAEGQRANEVGMVMGHSSGALTADKVMAFAGVNRPLREGLTLQVVADHGDRVMPCNGRDLQPQGVETVWRTALLDAIEEHLGSEDTTSPYQFRQMLFGWPWVLRDGALERWQVPPQHPLAERITALDAQLERRRVTSRQNVGPFAQAVYQPNAQPPSNVSA